MTIQALQARGACAAKLAPLALLVLWGWLPGGLAACAAGGSTAERGAASGAVPEAAPQAPVAPLLLPGSSTAPRVLDLPAALELPVALDLSAGPPSEPLQEPPVPAAPTASVGERSKAAIACIQNGEFEAARVLLTELLVEAQLERAAAALTAGEIESALPHFDRALEIDPKHPRALLESAEGRLMLAERMLSTPGKGAYAADALTDAELAYGAALQQLRKVDAPADWYARAVLGSAQVAWYQGRGAQALEHAREALALLRTAHGPLPGFLPTPERALANAAMLAWNQAYALGDASAAEALRRETEAALMALLGRTPEDPWVWRTLASIYLEAGAPAEAQAVLERALDHLPEQRELLEQLLVAARAAGGEEQVLMALARFARKHPSMPSGRFATGRQQFDAALRELWGLSSAAPAAECSALAERFLGAEQAFEDAARMDASWKAECESYQVVCRGGRGWALLYAGQLEAAREAFLAMERLRPRGLEWFVEGQLRDGVTGLALVAGAWNKRSESESVGWKRAECWQLAGEINEDLAAYQPRELNWANDAGFFLRDAAVEFEILGRRLCAAARGEAHDEQELILLREATGLARPKGQEKESAVFAKSAELLLERARSLMERSDAAYAQAALLGPEDVRTLNDGALVRIYYLHRDLEAAEQTLLRCVELGAEQLQSQDLGDAERDALTNAWGDVHENLGVLYLGHRGDPERARGWFERALEIGPEPRPSVTEFWLPLCDRHGPTALEAEHESVFGWALPCEADARR